MNHAYDPSLAAASPWWRPDPGTSLVVQGGNRLVGTYPISGAKNAVLPLMVSALITPHLLTLHKFLQAWMSPCCRTCCRVSASD